MSAAHVAACDTCPASVTFRRDDSNAPFWALAPVAPGSGSDHLATWCAACGPRHRRPRTPGALFTVGIVDPATGRTRQTVSGFDASRVLAAAARTRAGYPGSIIVNQSR